MILYYIVKYVASRKLLRYDKKCTPWFDEYFFLQNCIIMRKTFRLIFMVFIDLQTFTIPHFQDNFKKLCYMLQNLLSKIIAVIGINVRANHFWSYLKPDKTQITLEKYIVIMYTYKCWRSVATTQRFKNSHAMWSHVISRKAKKKK